MKRPRSKLVAVSLFSILILLLTFWLFWSGNPGRQKPAGDQKQEAKTSNETTRTNLSTPAPTISPTNSPAVAGTTSSVTNTQRIEEAVALNSLKRWIKQRDGKDVEIVDAQKVYDMDGKPTSMNVLVTTRLDGLTGEKLKAQLAEIGNHERDLKEQLHGAYQRTDIAAVNQLAAEFSEGRTTFITTNEVSSYKISLSKERPPVLSFWPGLPFETVREEEARSLAAIELGNTVGLQGFVHYTSATALLCFTNDIGSRVYIDPFLVAEVPLKVLQSPHGRTARGDAGRESRIAAQWADFLQP